LRTGAPSIAVDPLPETPSRKSRQILMPLGVSRSEVRPTRIERRARLVNAIARGRRWLDEIVSGSVINIEQIATRQKCNMRQVNMTISLAFLAPDPSAGRSDRCSRLRRGERSSRRAEKLRPVNPAAECPFRSIASFSAWAGQRR